MGSRSMRAGINWLVLGTLTSGGPATVMDLLDKIGVERLMDGRCVSADGSMSGILAGWHLRQLLRCVAARRLRRESE
jgi:hypothetical protein